MYTYFSQQCESRGDDEYVGQFHNRNDDIFLIISLY
jgi:hypothetical protein